MKYSYFMAYLLLISFLQVRQAAYGPRAVLGKSNVSYYFLCFVFVQPTKTRKPKSHSAKPAKKTRKQKSPSNTSSNAKSTGAELDILSAAAMENLYYISHNAMDCLTFRGFGWQHSQKTKKKRKGRKKKKK
ncbi:small lysine-rich protein 1 [Nelusetta ayraudi]|uniref:small lysine-rich protein 1 n=1 Tax=Nelusetta ayraudi TaxID=303726 RepID=UPI003F6FACDB